MHEPMPIAHCPLTMPVHNMHATQTPEYTVEAREARGVQQVGLEG